MAGKYCERLGAGVQELMAHGDVALLPELRACAHDLVEEAQGLPSPLQRAAGAIRDCLERLGTGTVDPGQALPILASAIHELTNCVAREDHEGQDWLAVRGVTYELETLLPVPSHGRDGTTLPGGPNARIKR